MKEIALEKALEMIRAKYEKALKLEYVKNKVAWAVYHAWREISEGKGR